MSSSSPGPGPSESCSELSPASSLISSHNNSQDETEAPKQSQSTVVVTQEEETTVEEGEEEAVVTASIIIKPKLEQEKIQQLIKEAVEEPVEEPVVAPVVEAAAAPKVPEEKKANKPARKNSRKSKQAPVTPSPTPQKASSEESLSELCSVSPVPPPRRRSKAKHRPATPLPLSGDEDSSVATELTEQMVVQAVALVAQEAPPAPAPEQTADAAAPKRPITDAVTTWLQTAKPPLSVDSDVEDEDDTGPKNAQGNPLPAPSSSGPKQDLKDGPEKRVARLGLTPPLATAATGSDSCSELSAEWDTSWDAPALQGDKFYRLTAERPQDAWLDAQQLTDSGIESGDEPPPAKFVRYLPDQEPLPCAGAVCCSIQWRASDAAPARVPDRLTAVIGLKKTDGREDEVFAVQKSS